MFIYIGLQGTIKWWIELPLLHANSCGVNKIASDIFSRVKNRLAITHFHFASWNYHEFTGFCVISINRNNHLCHLLSVSANILHWCSTCSAWDSRHCLDPRISTLGNVRYKVVPLLAAISLKVSYVATFRAFFIRVSIPGAFALRTFALRVLILGAFTLRTFTFRPLNFGNSHNAIEDNHSVEPLIFCKGIRAAAEYANW